MLVMRSFVLCFLFAKSDTVLQYKWLSRNSKGSYIWSSSGFHSWAVIVHYIYMNDLPACIQDVNTNMYADDTSLNKAIRTSQQLKEELVPAFSKFL